MDRHIWLPFALYLSPYNARCIRDQIAFPPLYPCSFRQIETLQPLRLRLCPPH